MGAYDITSRAFGMAAENRSERLFTKNTGLCESES